MKAPRMTHAELVALSERILAAWNTQDVEQVLACYTENLEYRDPNTRGQVRGAEAMRKYLTKLFANWRMHWTLREAFPLGDEAGAGVLWHATFRRPDGNQIVEADGMDLMLVENDRLSRNEVYFDRSVLAPQQHVALKSESSSRSGDPRRP